MFALSIRRIGAAEGCDLPGLRRHRASLGPHFVCDVYVDAGRFDLKVGDDVLTVAEATADLGTVCRLDLRGASGAVLKPLMLGLPVYVAAGGDRLVVSTRLRSLRGLGVLLEPRSSVLPEYFVYRYVTPPNTLLENVRALPVGGRLSFRVQGDRLHQDDIEWTTVFAGPRHQHSLEEGCKLFERDLVDRVAALSPRRRQVACLLSGGLDSSALFTIARDTLSVRESHSSGYPFEDPEYECRAGERHYAETAARALGSTHRFHEFTTREFLHGLIEAIDRAEVPLIHLQGILLGLLFRSGLSERERIVLCGQGADGIVGLTLMFNYMDKRYLVKRPLAPFLRMLSAAVPESFFPFGQLHRWSLRRWNGDYARPDHAVWMMGEFGDRDWVRSHFGVDDTAIVRGRLDALQHMKPEDPLDAFSLLDFVSDVAVTQDIWGQLAAACGRTLYLPFNSHGALDAARNIPWSEKLSQPKRLMVRLGERLGIPTFILHRPKLGFGVKSSRWSEPGGPADPIVGLIGPEVDEALVRSLQGPVERRAMLYWNWMNYGLWKRLVINGEKAGDIAAELDRSIDARAH